MTTRRRKKNRPEEVVAKLRDADAMLNAGKDLAAVLQALPRCTSSRGSLGRTATPRASTAGSAMSSWRWRSSRAFGMPADCLRR